MYNKNFLLLILLFFIFILNNSITFAHWANDTLSEFQSMGYLPNNTLITTPNIYISKGQAAQIVNLFYSFEETPNDVSNSLKIANEKGYLLDLNETSFITREESAVMICRLINLEEDLEEASEFEDDETISQWAKPYVSSLKHYNIIKGFPDNCFKPKEYLRLCELVTMLSRIDGMGGPGDIEPVTESDETGFIIYRFIEGLNELYTIPIDDELTITEGETIKLAFGNSFKQLDYSIENENIVQFDKDFNLLEALSKGSTYIKFFTDNDLDTYKQIRINIIEKKEEQNEIKNN